jgi:serine/threonine-protein kinase
MIVTLECPENESWQLLLTEALPDDRRERYERHLESCPACQARLDQSAKDEELLDLAREVGDPTGGPTDATLIQVVDRLLEGKASHPTIGQEPAELYFLLPSHRSDLLGLLGEYEVQEVIGQGGMGVVLKGFEPALHRLVAIKVLAPALGGSATARRRFTREAQAAAAVCHDHVVAVHGVHESDGLPYLVMQYVAGESLQARLDRTGPLEIAEVVCIGMQTAAGLAAAHAQGLIHRDIKPANLLLENGLARVKITDFGLARTADDVQLTRDGVVAGTPEYMAPEQARGEPVDHRADLFSLGSVLYAVCTGLPPFRGPSAVAVLRRVSDQQATPVRSLNPAVPAWLDAVITRLMAKDRAQRFQSAAEVAGLLEGYLAHLRQPASVVAPELPSCPSSGEAGPTAPRPGINQRKWLVAAAALVGSVGLLGVIGASLLSSRGGMAGSARLAGPDLPKSMEPKDGLICLLVNKQSGRCLTVVGAATTPGTDVGQGPRYDRAGSGERWQLLGTEKAVRLRNEKSGLFLEINQGFTNNGAKAVAGADQPTKPSQLWSIEPVWPGYRLRPGHCKRVLAIGGGSLASGARAIQWDQYRYLEDQIWVLLPAPPASDRAPEPEQPRTTLALDQESDLAGTAATHPSARINPWLVVAVLIGGSILSTVLLALYVARRYRAETKSVAATASNVGAERMAAVPRVLQRMRIRPWHVLAVLLLVAAVGLATALLVQQATAPPSSKDIYQDFRGSRPLLSELTIDGGDADEVSRPEAEGLRVTMPATRRNPGPVGARVTCPISGDFEITATFEILSADPPRQGNGVGVALNISTDPDLGNFAKLGRFYRAGEGSVFLVESWNKDRPGSYLAQGIPTNVLTGQLRLVRDGSTLRYLVTEGPGDDFRELHRDNFGPDDLSLLRFVVNNSGSPAGVDARLVDLRIRSGKRAAEIGITGANRWLTGVGLLVLVLGLGAVGAWLVLRRSGFADETSAPTGGVDATGNHDAAARVMVRCSGCGKNLKARNELAGKKVKCPQCGQVLQVPPADAVGSKPAC